ncbi:glycosyltransferase family 4 protein [Phenylobacterium sp. LH3H17]|uniref:glycosyltransferase family 4 protein n=1 Tax=Phenylobacterium sp. LH3H17 TaxID=2903901 RepID=UPI0020C97232|nr:glycosyltransferase family 4 protein [Phenylobacterium sp. LH3H17]UTP37845.1 glycosyltransferase family 4 protein [Phenylobacterium sp. LH3H17]
MSSRLAIFHPAGKLGLGQNFFGKDVANLDLYRALVAHGGFEAVDILTLVQVGLDQVAPALTQGRPTTTKLGVDSVLATHRAVAAGALLRGQPDLADLAWLRRQNASDRAYSLVGLIHTIAPPASRMSLALNQVAPIQPWDALICTSPAVQDALTDMFEGWGDYLAHRFGDGGRRAIPKLPLVPLGVDGARFQALADRPEVRAKVRADLGLGEDDILVLWVGRLSFFEKAFPQPMFAAVDEAARATGKRVQFALVGWFPNEPVHRPLYEKAARAYGPSVTTHFLDGNDPEVVGGAWAAGDIFLSLVDNIQETFGITPIEAMAAGLPVVVSDWDGYRYTVRDGQEGFLVPTLGAPANGQGQGLAARHAVGMDAYQNYVGAIAQHTAVHVGRAAQALAALIADPALRARMGAAGRERIRTTFDWPVVVGEIRALLDELAAIRAAAGDVEPSHRIHPVKGDPFADFAGFASQVLAPETPLALRSGVDPANLVRTDLDSHASVWRANTAECAEICGLLASGQAATVGDVLARFPPARGPALELAIVWMAKLGVIDWL